MDPDPSSHGTFNSMTWTMCWVPDYHRRINMRPLHDSLFNAYQGEGGVLYTLELVLE